MGEARLKFMACILILLGAPGAGKGTQAVRLAEAYGLTHVSTGDLFRVHLSQGSSFGLKAKEYMDAGALVPDEVVLDMLAERVGQPDCEKGYQLDGFPRTLAQAESLGARLSPDDQVVVLALEVSEETIIRRAAGRLLCRSCGNIQHVDFKPPARGGICDSCGGELYRRPDDAPEVVRERVAVYQNQTAQLVEFYDQLGVLTRVDGERAPDEIFEGLRSVIAERGVDLG
jgi:adenylate kinase